MCPDKVGPGCVAEKIGVEPGYGKVVHPFIGASVVDFSDSQSLTIVAHQLVARSQIACRHPAATFSIERMLCGGADDLPAGCPTQDRCV